MLGRRRPLLRGAAVAGGAFLAGKRAQQNRSQQEADVEYQDESPSPTSTIDQLKELAELRDQGVLTEDEFEQQKQKLLANS
jgi:DNA-binding IclR family transcriptional regulator